LVASYLSYKPPAAKDMKEGEQAVHELSTMLPIAQRVEPIDDSLWNKRNDHG